MWTDIKSRERAHPMVLLILICIAVSIISSAIPAGASSLLAENEHRIWGGSDCSDFMNGFSVGLGFGALFGCWVCGGVALAAKGVAMFC